MPPPPLDGEYQEMGDTQEGEAHPQGRMGISFHKDGLRFPMDYYERLSRILVEEGVSLVRAQDISTDPKFIDI